MSNTDTLARLLADAEAAYARGDYATAEAIDNAAEALSDATYAATPNPLAGLVIKAGPIQYVYVASPEAQRHAEVAA